MRIRQQLCFVSIILFCLILHSACATDGKRTGAHVDKTPKTYVFECPNKERFTVRFENNNALLFLPMGFVTIPRVQSVSGAKYSDGKTTVWHRGEQAIVNLGGKPMGNCINNSKEVAWERARLDGVNLRAVGNNPGWYLEITNDKSIVFVKDNNKKRYEFPFAPPTVNGATAKTKYETRKDDQQLIVVTTGQECRDLASGQVYERTVTLKFDGKSYSGCGRVLN